MPIGGYFVGYNEMFETWARNMNWELRARKLSKQAQAMSGALKASETAVEEQAGYIGSS